MYLVTIETRSLGEETVYTPKIETIQAFNYQLKSPEWSVIDFIPVKGAQFELHFGEKINLDQKDNPEEGESVAVIICDCQFSAMVNAVRLLNVFGMTSADHKKGMKHFNVSELSTCTVLYIKSHSDADSFYIPRLNLLDESKPA